MKIAIQAADLDNNRIDGTRVYLYNLLKYFGKLSPQNDFLIYHKNKFNSQLTPPNFSNYYFKKINFPLLWTQTSFSWNIWKENVDILWMPMHNIPLLRKKRLKTIVTIHDLAFKKFPQYFTFKNLSKLNILTDLAIKKSTKIIAVSHSTKQDILNFYPHIKEEKIKVIYHGFDKSLFFKQPKKDVTNKILKKFNLHKSQFILYVGAIQPRKNLITLIQAFEIFKKNNLSSFKLVLAGEKAWQWKKTIQTIQNSPFSQDIILTGKINFQEITTLYQNASLFVFPSFYEGFGIPILEALASNTPTLAARNSSLTEVGGKAVQYFSEKNINELAKLIENVLYNKILQEKMIAEGKNWIKNFSWEKCAQETLDFLLN